MKCYHFCSREFLNQLKKEKEIFPINKMKRDNKRFAYQYLFDNLNDGNDMFFCWGSKKNKGEKIKYDKLGEYALITFDIPENEIILTNYYNWCDVIYLLDNEIFDIELAGQIAIEEFGVSETNPIKAFNKIYNSIFDLNDGYKYVQILTKRFKADWIKKIEYVKEKII